MRPLTVLVVGLGALGTVFAALLKGAGHRVFALVRPRHLEALAGGAVEVDGIWGAHRARLDGVAADAPSFAGESYDLVVLTVKSYDTEEAAGQVAPLVGERTLVLVAQNGYGNYETVAGAVGREHTLLGRVIFGSRLLSPGRAEVTVIADAVRIGQPEGAVAGERVREVAAALDGAGIPAAFAPDVYAILWDKILYNSALNPLGAVLECTYGELAAEEGTREVMDAVVREIFAVARARSIALRWDSPERYLEHFYSRLVPPTAAHFPSMHYDLKAGKRLEIDALNGAVVRLGRQAGVPVPVNETVVRLLEAKRRIARARNAVHSG